MKQQRPRQRREPEIIEAFCRALAEATGESVRVICHEDTVRGSWDAVLNRDGCEWALDLRRMNQVEGEMHEQALWQPLRGPLEEATNAAFPGEWGDIDFHGGEIVQLRESGRMPALRDLVADVLDALRQRHRWNQQRRSVGSRTGLSLTTRRARGRCGFRVSHVAPGDHVRQLQVDLGKAMSEKSLQLSAAKREGRQTILLLECDNIAIVAPEDVHEAFTGAAATPAAGQSLDVIDEVWFVREIGRRLEAHALRRKRSTLSAEDFAQWRRDRGRTSASKSSSATAIARP